MTVARKQDSRTFVATAPLNLVYVAHDARLSPGEAHAPAEASSKERICRNRADSGAVVGARQEVAASPPAGLKSGSLIRPLGDKKALAGAMFEAREARAMTHCFSPAARRGARRNLMAVSRLSNSCI